jgi:hypothetical protein
MEQEKQVDEEEYISEEERRTWVNRVSSNIEKRKKRLIKNYGFDKENFASDYEHNLGLDFSIPFIEKSYPDDFYAWEMEKQAQLANAEVRSSVLHNPKWSLDEVKTRMAVFIITAHLFLFFRTNAEMVANLAFQALYSKDKVCRQRAYFVYYMCTCLARVCDIGKLLWICVFSFASWIFIPSPLPYGLYVILSIITLTVFMWSLFHINVLNGDYRRKMQTGNYDWKKIMNDEKNLPEDKKKLLKEIKMRVFSARIRLARDGDTLKDKKK